MLRDAVVDPGVVRIFLRLSIKDPPSHVEARGDPLLYTEISLHTDLTRTGFRRE